MLVMFGSTRTATMIARSLPIQMVSMTASLVASAILGISGMVRSVRSTVRLFLTTTDTQVQMSAPASLLSTGKARTDVIRTAQLFFEPLELHHQAYALALLVQAGTVQPLGVT